MKKLTLLLACLCFVFGQSFSQVDASTKSYSEEEYQRYYEARLKVDIRNYMLRALDLEAAEIEAIDPLMRAYMNERVALAERKIKMVEDYEEEMKEDDSKADEIEETGDFIENYWEASIDEMQLKKRYFDAFENRIPYQKALEFFMLEDELQYQITRPTILRVAPVLLKMEEITGTSSKHSWEKMDHSGMGYNSSPTIDKPLNTIGNTEIEVEKNGAEMNSDIAIKNPTIYHSNPNNWNNADHSDQSSSTNNWHTADKEEGAGADFFAWTDSTERKVGLDHEYTHDVLNAMTAALREMNEGDFFSSTDVESKLTSIEAIADKLQEDWTSTKHADWTREAFISITSLLEEAQKDERFTEAKEAVAKAASAARMIDANRLMTDQAATIYTFVDTAKEAMQVLKENLMSDNSEESTADRDW